MVSIFGRLLKKELGKANYVRYAATCREVQPQQTELRKALYQDIYLQLAGHSSEVLSGMRNRLAEAMLRAFYINKGYLPIFLCSMISVIVLYALDLPAVIFLFAAGAVTLLFGIKTYEYILNHYCHVDAQLLLLYKTALEERIQRAADESREKEDQI